MLRLIVAWLAGNGEFTTNDRSDSFFKICRNGYWSEWVVIGG